MWRFVDLHSIVCLGLWGKWRAWRKRAPSTTQAALWETASCVEAHIWTGTCSGFVSLELSFLPLSHSLSQHCSLYIRLLWLSEESAPYEDVLMFHTWNSCVCSHHSFRPDRLSVSLHFILFLVSGKSGAVT